MDKLYVIIFTDCDETFPPVVCKDWEGVNAALKKEWCKANESELDSEEDQFYCEGDIEFRKYDEISWVSKSDFEFTIYEVNAP